MIILMYNANTNINIPKSFVYLKDIDASIQVSLRYSSSENFTGKKVDGYLSKNVVILTYEAAVALSNAQKEFQKNGYSIIVYDAYRPQRAVNNFINWLKDKKDQGQKTLYYPRIDKKNIFRDGYILAKSSHSRGSTVDISIIKIDKKLHKIKPIPRKLLDGEEIFYLDDGTVDMGTSFDLFDKASHHENSLILPEYKGKREYLKKTMEANGFESIPEEWWHFSLISEPFKDKYWNFTIQ